LKAVASLFMRECARTGSLFLHCFSIQKTPTCAAFFLVSPCRSSVVWLGGRGRPLFRCQLSHIHAKQKGPEPCGPTSPDGAGAVRAPSKPAAAGGGRPRITMAFSKPVGVNPGPSSVEVVEKASPFNGWPLKACQRCGGDLFWQYGEGPTCLQCSYSGPTAWTAQRSRDGRTPQPCFSDDNWTLFASFPLIAATALRAR